MLQPAVELIKTTKKIGSRTIIEDLSFRVRPGEIFGLLGPNGAGKTTTIRMIVGLISLSAGEILIKGHSLKSEFTVAISQVGAIVENPEFYNYLTGYQNLACFKLLSPNIPRERLSELVTFLGMEDYIGRPVATYSLGMRQRLGIALALLHRPSVLILDEPTNGLDPEGIKELREHLRLLADQEGVAVIVSSHILAEMELLCDRAAIIKRGRLLAITDLAAKIETETVWFTVSDLELARTVMERGFSGTVMMVEKEQLKVAADRETTARINAALVDAGIRVFGIQNHTRSLEELFMEVTYGGVAPTDSE